MWEVTLRLHRGVIHANEVGRYCSKFGELEEIISRHARIIILKQTEHVGKTTKSGTKQAANISSN